MNDNTPVSEVLFDIIVSMSERFPSLNPLSIRQMRAREVFLFIRRFIAYSKKEKRDKDGNRIIRRPAGDNWF